MDARAALANIRAMSSRRLPAIIAFLAIVLAAPPARSQVLISEFMASNSKTLKDDDGSYSDWIELFNATAESVQLKGWFLTDDSLNLQKWVFPDTLLRPGKHLVVFASNKNRGGAGAVLHTNFKLGTAPGYLALVQPDGTNIVSQFAPHYPLQMQDVSFGLGVLSTNISLLATNAPAAALVPANADLGDTWTSLDFDDTAWTHGLSGIGFSSSAPDQPAKIGAQAILAAGPLAYWPFNETAGTSATNLANPNLPAVYTNGVILAQPGLRPPDFTGFETTNNSPKLDGLNDYITVGTGIMNNLSAFTMAGWIKPGALNLTRSGLWGQHDVVEFGFLEPGNLLLSTGNGGSAAATYPFPINEWHFLAAVGDGQELRIYIDGALAATGGEAAIDYGSSAYPFNIGGGGILDTSGDWFKGQVEEVAVYGKALDDDEILNLYLSGKNPAQSYGNLVKTDIGAAMKGVNGSVYARFPFAVGKVADIDFVNLRLRYDDGFVAYLNGVEIARRNAPETPEWDSAASDVRAGATGLRLEEFNLSSQVGLLREGRNVLAIHGLNMAATDSDFLLQPELTATIVTLDTNAWRYFTTPTPGLLNGPGNTNLGPLILDVAHVPAQPTDDQAIAVTARPVQTLGPVASVKLTYRVMYGAELQVAMLDDGAHGDGAAGDGVYGAIIPASVSAPGQMVRYFVTSADTSGRTNRWPSYLDKLNSPQYLGTVVQDPSLTNRLPVLHWFVQNPASADTTTGTRASLFFDGEFYDNIGTSLHGQSSSGFPKKSYNMNLNTGFHFRYDPAATPAKNFNLLTIYPDKAHMRNMLAYETYKDAGSPYHVVIPMRVQQNGKFYSDAHYVEDGNADYLDRVGLDSNGALYKMYNVFDSTSGAEKKTRRIEGTADLQAFITGLGQTGAAKTRFIFDNANIPAMVNYLAAMIVTGNVDCCHKNYYAYRDTEGTGEWEFLPWDQDLSFGRDWTGTLNYFDDKMYFDNPLYIGNNNTLIAALFAIPGVQQMYLRRLRTLMDDLLQPPGTPVAELKYEAQMDRWYDLISPDAALDFAKWATWGTKQTMAQAVNIMKTNYMIPRRNYLFNTQSGTKGPIPLAQPPNLTILFGDMDFNPVSGNQNQEYIQLRNTNKISVDISGWKLDGAIQYTFRSGVVIPTNGFLYVTPNSADFRARAVGPRGGQGLFVQGGYKGRLSARGGTVVLSDTAGRAVQSITYEGTPTAAQLSLRVTEIMANPPPPSVGSSYVAEDFQFVALQNTGLTPLGLDGVRFVNGIDFVFPPGAGRKLQPGRKLYLAKNPGAFASRYGVGFDVVGPFVLNLSKQGEQIAFVDATGEKVLDFSYNTGWLPDGAQSNHSLVIRDAQSAWDHWGDKDLWQASELAGGTPAQNGFAEWKKLFFSADELADPAVSGELADPDHDGFANKQEFLSGTDPKNPQSFLKLAAQSAANGTLTLLFQPVVGHTYSILARDSLTEGAWVKLADFAPGDTAPVRYADPSVPNRKQRFYRLVTPAVP